MKMERFARTISGDIWELKNGVYVKNGFANELSVNDTAIVKRANGIIDLLAVGDIVCEMRYNCYLDCNHKHYHSVDDETELNSILNKVKSGQSFVCEIITFANGYPMVAWRETL